MTESRWIDFGPDEHIEIERTAHDSRFLIHMADRCGDSASVDMDVWGCVKLRDALNDAILDRLLERHLDPER